MRLGEPTSSLPSGVTVAAFTPKPAARIASAASDTQPFDVSRRLLERQVVALELQLEPDHVGVEHAERLLEQLLPGLVALEDDDPQAVRHAAAGAVELELVRSLLQRGDHEREVLVEVDAERLRALAQLVAVDRGREGRRLHLLLDRLRRQAVDPGGADVGAGHDEARQLVDREQRLLHLAVA